MNIEVNFPGIFLSAAASILIRFAWYSLPLFGKQWMKLKGHTSESFDKERGRMRSLFSLSFAFAFLTAYMLWIVMALVENFYHYPRILNGLTSGFFMWLGFIMPVQATEEIFGGKNRWLFAINSGYQLVSILAMGIILGAPIGI
jgi:hypothetical protein